MIIFIYSKVFVYKHSEFVVPILFIYFYSIHDRPLFNQVCIQKSHFSTFSKKKPANFSHNLQKLTQKF